MKRGPTLPSLPVGDAPRLVARLPVVLKMTGLGRSAIYRWIAVGSFPAPVRLGPRYGLALVGPGPLDAVARHRAALIELRAPSRVQGGRSPAQAHP